MRRALLLHNPRAGQRRAGRALSGVTAALSATFELEVAATTGPDHARALARRAVEERFEALFALGGDGTLRVLAEILAGTPVALGALPGGTTNVVACATLGLPADVVAAARALTAGEPREIDLGRAGESVFLMQVSGGLDARIMAAIAAVDPRWKRRFGKLAIAWIGLSQWARYRFQPFALEVDGEAVTATGFVVANLAEYAGRFAIVPGARADDQKLELLLFHGRRRQALGFALDLARGRHAERRDVEICKFERLRLLGPAGAPLQYDGDAFALVPPLEVALSDRRLRLLAPAPASGQASVGAR